MTTLPRSPKSLEEPLPGLLGFYWMIILGFILSIGLDIGVFWVHLHHTHTVYQTIATVKGESVPIIADSQLSSNSRSVSNGSPKDLPDTDPLVEFLFYISPLVSLGLLGILGWNLRLFRISRQRTLELAAANSALNHEMKVRANMAIEQKQLEKAIHQGQKLQAIGTLAGGIAHDFNNLLYAIIGYTELTMEDVSADSLTHRNLSKVVEAAHRGQDLVSRILTFSRRQHHDFRPIILSSVFESTQALLKPTIPTSVILQVSNQLPAHFTVWGDATELQQVLVNIVNNAVDAMNGEGHLTILATLLEASDPLFQDFSDEMSVRYAEITINDTGCGMDDKTLERLFEPFFTTKEVGKGTGLGLATAHAILQEHQGDIRATSTVGSGTTFTLLLPEYT